MNVDEMFDRIIQTDTCWIWTGAHHEQGYGRVWFEGKLRPTHRVIYELLVGPIPDGLVIDHLCRNPPCVNPEHLEPVTAWENSLRGEGGKVDRAKTACPKGHPYDIFEKDGKRRCRTCKNAIAKANYYKRKHGKTCNSYPQVNGA